jgi:hypothetical protein
VGSGWEAGGGGKCPRSVEKFRSSKVQGRCRMSKYDVKNRTSVDMYESHPNEPEPAKPRTGSFGVNINSFFNIYV